MRRSNRKVLTSDDNCIVHSLEGLSLKGDGEQKPSVTKSPKLYHYPPKQSKGIKTILKLLDELQVVYSTEVHFGAACHHWKPLPFDVVVVIKGKVGLIEFDGQQHFNYNNNFTKTKEDLINQQTRDLLKTIFAKKHSLSLLRVAYDCDDKKIKRFVADFLSGINQQANSIYLFSSAELYGEHIKMCQP